MGGGRSDSPGPHGRGPGRNDGSDWGLLECIQFLVDCGHDLRVIIGGQMPGLPYLGYSLPMVKDLTKAAMRVRHMADVHVVSGFHLSLGSLFDKKAGKSLQRWMEQAP